MQRDARLKRAGRSERTSESCERKSERTSEWPSTYIWVFELSGPLCSSFYPFLSFFVANSSFMSFFFASSYFSYLPLITASHSNVHNSQHSNGLSPIQTFKTPQHCFSFHFTQEILYLHGTVGQNNQEPRRKYWATRSSVRSFACSAHSFACSALLVLLARTAALTCSLARTLCSLPRSWDSE